jgi:hypothetical protein
MKRSVTSFICFVFVLCSAGQVSVAQGKLDHDNLSASEACKAARMEADFSGIIEMPASLKEDIEKYRQGWRNICNGKGETSFYHLFIYAKNIESGFGAVFQQADEIIGVGKANASCYEKAEPIQQLFYTQYPSFVPLFDGNYFDFIYFELSLREFSKYAFLGDEEDKLFFKEFLDLRGTSKFPPWIEGTWDYGGCFRFGEYKWVKALERIDHLEVTLSKPAYRRMIKKLKQEMNSSFDDYYPRFEGALFVSSEICVCDDKNAVKSELSEVLNYIKDKHGYEKMAKGASFILKRIQNNTFTIKSEKEAHCSGG